VLSVPAPFSIAPSGHLSVTEFLLLNLHTVLENNTLATRIKFSKKSPLLELLTDFASRPVPRFQTALSLCNCASSAFQDRDKSVIHPSFPDDPLPMWVVSYWAAMSHALESQCDWHTSYDWVLDRLDVVPADGQELEVVDEVLDVLESLPWDAPLKGFSTQTNLRTMELQPLLASCLIHGCVLDSMIAAVVEQMWASDDENLQSVSVEPLDFADILQLNEKRWNNYEMDRAFIHLHTIGSALHDGTLHCVLFPINIDNVHWAVIEVNTVN
jgi:hypothetical protein